MPSKKKKKSSSADMPSPQKSQSSKLSVQASGSTKKRKSFKPVKAAVHSIDSTNSLRRALVKAHERYGRVSPKKLVYFKKKGKVELFTIPIRGALDFKVKDCPVCVVMKNKRPKKPTAILFENKRQLRPWEKVFSNSSGKFAVMSLQGNRYYSIFVCARSGQKLNFAHKKDSHYPMVYLKFLAIIGHSQNY